MMMPLLQLHCVSVLGLRDDVERNSRQAQGLGRGLGHVIDSWLSIINIIADGEDRVALLITYSTTQCCAGGCWRSAEILRHAATT